MNPETDKNLAQQFIDAYHNGAFPFLHAIRMEPLEIGDGAGSLRIVLEEQHLRYGGIMHGGVATALLDTALGLAAATKAPPQHNVYTAQMNVNFIKAARAGEALIGSARVMHAGRRTCVCRASIHAPDGELVASASGTLLFVPMPIDDAEHLLSLGRATQPG